MKGYYESMVEEKRGQTDRSVKKKSNEQEKRSEGRGGKAKRVGRDRPVVILTADAGASRNSEFNVC